MNLLKTIYYKVTNIISSNCFVVSYFGNTLGILLNMRWRIYHRKCNAVFTEKSHNGAAIELKNNGLVFLGTFECSELSQRVSYEFNKIGSARSPAKSLPRQNCGQFSKDIFHLLIEVAPIIESYYQSYFQPYWISIQENFPGIVSADSSFGYHIDDNPRELMKIFIYFNDVTERNGAFRAFPRIHSKRILRKGFISYSPETRLESQSLVNAYLKENPNSLAVMEGKAGTLVMFDNNLCHKGTPPIEGYRQLAQIEIYPSLKKIKEEQVFNALTRPIVYDYPRDPFNNDIAGH